MADDQEKTTERLTVVSAQSDPEEFARIIERDIAKWKQVVKEGNIKVQ
jgi:tripartite-type tricarboxylate transporter receptor subunit TctC